MLTPLVLLVAVVLFPIAFLLAELCARGCLAIRARYDVWAPHTRTLQVLDRDAFPGLPPLARFEVNRDGERGEEPPKATWDTYRVLVVGGSAAECRFIDQRSAWPAVAHRFLGRSENLELLRARRAHVGNLGRSLTTSRQLALILRRVLPRYQRLDAIVLMAGASDVVHWLSVRASGRIGDESVEPDEIFDEHPEGPFEWRVKELALWRVAAAWNRGLFRPIADHDGAGRGVARARKARAQAEEVIDTLPDPAAMLDHFDRNFRELIRCAQSKARTVIVVRPCWARGGIRDGSAEHGWMFAAGDLRTGDNRAWYSQRVADCLLEMVERRMSAIARDCGAAEIDPKPLLHPTLEHFYDVCHLSPAGCEILGRAVAQAVLRERKGRFTSRLRAVAGERHADVA